MENFIKLIIDYDTAGNYSGIISYVPESGANIYDVLNGMHILLKDGRFRAAYILSKFLENMNVDHVICHLTRAIGGALYNQEDKEIGLRNLKTIMLPLSNAESKLICDEIIYPSVMKFAFMAYSNNNQNNIIDATEILKAASPLFNEIFDFSGPVTDIDIGAMREKGRTISRLIKYEQAPEESRKYARKVVIAVREKMFPNQPRSRTLDIGPRLVKAMDTYGWEAYFYGMQWADISEDYNGIAEKCISINADILFIDDHVIDSPFARIVRARMIDELREKLPSLKIVGLQFDSWSLNQEVLIQESQRLDIIWDEASPTLPTWNHPNLAGKVFRCPFPRAVTTKIPSEIVRSQAVFSGGIKGYNWHRMFWMASIQKYYLPVINKFSSHEDDGLDPISSYAKYMQGLADATCVLNLSMRPDLSFVATARSFEAIQAGSLLIQENTDDMNHYFISGEHYLSFRRFSDLRSTFRFISENRELAEDIRRSGADFANKTYGDIQIISYLDYLLYYTNKPVK